MRGYLRLHDPQYSGSSSRTSVASDASAPDGQWGTPHAAMDPQLACPLTSTVPGLRTPRDPVLRQSGSLSLADGLYVFE
jgi:hypothetical protein